MGKRKGQSYWRKKLWNVFRQYILKRDHYICVTCFSQVEGRNAQAGHYIAKGACSNEYYFSEYNVHCQCAGCNLFLEGNRPAMREYIIRRYGEEVLNDIEQNYHKPVPSFDFEGKIRYYEEKLKEL